ncbi:cyclin-dependent kinase 4 [Fopius arisanus]|uniref:cyclin-dependent kinase n=1 Tax=Fopius arisanus TaxID=64838 RepID=A0A9R1U7Y5_9HYME|nr:PREDICTED: cyclin-dependent kinase 4 [Fopius arisanus]
MAERRRLPSSEPPSGTPTQEKRAKLQEEQEPQGEEPNLLAEETLDTTPEDAGTLEVEEAVPSTSGTLGLVQSTTGRKAEGSLESSFIGEHAHYQELSQIGDGAYGTVYKAKDVSSGQVVALKKVRVSLTEDGLPTSTLREIAGLKQLERFEHPNIVKLLDVCHGMYLPSPERSDGTRRPDRPDKGLTLWLVFEHVDRDLAKFISDCPTAGASPALINQMSREILLGVDFLHSHRIIHRDLKPQNILVTTEGRIKIADFGFAKTYDFEMRLTSVVVTLWYRAPEVLLGCAYATPVDLWSVGCVLAELNTLKPLFPGSSEGDQLDRIFKIIGTPTQEAWPKNVSLSYTAFPQRIATPLRIVIPSLSSSGIDLISNMLTFDPHVRLTASQALQHPYFTTESS